MLQFIMDQNLLLYICGAACAAGVVSQFLLRYLYKRLTGEIQDTGGPKGAFIRQMQQRFQNCVHLNEKIADISSFADRSMMDYRFLRMNLHQWSRLGGGALAVCLLCCGAGLWMRYRSGGDISLQTSYILAGILSLLLIGAAYGIADNRYRHISLKVRLMDYLQNSGALKDYREVEFPASVEEGVGEAQAQTAAVQETGAVSISRKRHSAGGSETRAQKEKRELKDALSRTRSGLAQTAAAQESGEGQAGSGDPSGELKKSILQQMDPKEKEQLLKEVLMEFLA